MHTPALPPSRTDFGLSETRVSRGSRNRLAQDDLGLDVSPLWASPEALLGEAQTTASDVYSFAIVLWECLSRKLPFAGSTMPWEINARVIDGLRPSFESAHWVEGLREDGSSEAICGIVERAWERDQDVRPKMAEIIDVIDKVVRSRALALPSAREGADALRKGAASRVKRPYEIEFGELDVGKELARGAFGAVHRAIWRGTVVAVKVQLSKTLADKQLHECVAEGARSSQARHPLRRPHDAPVSSSCHPPPSQVSLRARLHRPAASSKHRDASCCLSGGAEPVHCARVCAARRSRRGAVPQQGRW